VREQLRAQLQRHASDKDDDEDASEKAHSGEKH